MAFAVSASAVGRVAFLGANSGLKASTPSGPRSTGRGGVVTTRAFFNFGGVKQPAGVAMVCRDCGYVYRGMDFNDLPKDYKCPPCGSGKNAFRPEKKVDFVKDGFNAPGARATGGAGRRAARQDEAPRDARPRREALRSGRARSRVGWREASTRIKETITSSVSRDDDSRETDRFARASAE